MEIAFFLHDRSAKSRDLLSDNCVSYSARSKVSNSLKRPINRAFYNRYRTVIKIKRRWTLKNDYGRKGHGFR